VLLSGLGRESQKRETGSIRSEGDLGVDLEDSGWILGFWGFCVHLNSRVLDNACISPPEVDVETMSAS